MPSQVRRRRRRLYPYACFAPLDVAAKQHLARLSSSCAVSPKRPPASYFKLFGKRVPRVDSKPKTDGSAQFTADFTAALDELTDRKLS
jgi:hypothetical protein